MRGKKVDQRGVHQQIGILVNLLDLAVLQHAIEWGALLVHQTIGRDVVGLKAEGRRYVARPVIYVLVGESKHQVDADIIDSSLANGLTGLHSLACRMAAAKEM